MRPTRLELSGFTSFREPVEVDFEGCDFFALIGPTGAGKSSVIDAISFALYGCIPRLGAGTAAPVISQGLLEARVRLDFTVGDDRYTAVRVLARTKTGATTREARLERDGEVLAGNADTVTARVERLLGLTFEQFTKCVVLPQGEFARFLHDKPGDRQALLRRLLDLEVYERMGGRAREIAAAKQETVRSFAGRLEDLAFATPESLGSARARHAQIEELTGRVKEAEPKVRELESDAKTAVEAATVAEDRGRRLAALRVPDGIDDLAARVATARDVHAHALRTGELAGAATHAAEEALAALPARAGIEVARAAHSERAGIVAELDAARAELATRVDNEARAAKDFEAAEETLRAAQDTLDAARVAHAAADLARHVVAGEACPVCGQVVVAAPEAHVPADLRAAERAAEAAKTAAKKADEARRRVERERHTAEAGIEAFAKRLADLDAKVAAHPDQAALVALLDRIAAAEESAAGARAAEREAAKKASETLGAAESARKAEETARRSFDETRDAVADLGPPAAARETLAADWRSLVAWASERVPAEQASAAEARAHAARVQAERDAVISELRTRCDTLGIRTVDGVVHGVATAAAEQSGVVERIEAALQEIERITRERKEAEEERAVAQRLGVHLSVKGFESWLLEEAMRILTLRASDNLRLLSADAYSLAHDRRTSAFMVIDHRNADERRSAKTLSGGETFLASLALALALAEEIAGMASEGARLDAMFLDEGFGTLDPETLEAVASAVETLAAAGRMVGIVTHVREVAERVPVRFEVRRGAASSTVERVES